MKKKINNGGDKFFIESRKYKRIKRKDFKRNTIKIKIIPKSKGKFKYFLLLVFIILLILIIKLNKPYTEINIIPKQTDINKEYYFDSISDSFKNSKNFLGDCLNNIFINDKSTFKLSRNPLVSIIIPIYNSEKFVSRAIKSVQNQNLTNLEIILINDFSTDNSLSLIEKLKTEDPRITIINNKKNMGILYSKSIGVLSCNGKYIFSLDNDDMFLDKDVLSVITDISIEGNFDIVEFRGIETKEGTVLLNHRIWNTKFSNHKLNLVLFQPELSNFPLRAGNTIKQYYKESIYIWCKYIKTNIYQKALNSLGEEKYSRYMLSHEDIITMIILFTTATSYKFVGKYGILHIKRPKSAFFLNDQFSMTVNVLYLLDAAIDFMKNTDKHKELVPQIFYNVLNLGNLQDVLKNGKYRELFYSCLNKFLNSNFYLKEYRDYIFNKSKSINLTDSHFFK